MRFVSRPEAWAALLLSALLARPAHAQGWREVQVFAEGVASHPAVVLAGVGLGRRDAARTRIGATIAAGVGEGRRLAGRGELMWHFLLDPAKRTGAGVYGGGGVAVTAMRGAHVRPFVQVVLGLEGAPAAAHGWFIEGGFGGGARLALGWRARTRRNATP